MSKNLSKEELANALAIMLDVPSMGSALAKMTIPELEKLYNAQLRKALHFNSLAEQRNTAISECRLAESEKRLLKNKVRKLEQKLEKFRGRK
jgi:hypothetical protein